MLYRITTEGDCEGRSTKDLGIYEGTLEQIITYMTVKGIKPYYNYCATPIQVVNCNGIIPEVIVNSDNLGYLSVKTLGDLQQRVAKEAALAKLSKEERALLGL